MIKKYAILTLLSVNFLQAERPTCYNSPYPLTPEQQKFCEMAAAFSALVEKRPDQRKDCIKLAIRQIDACTSHELTHSDQIKHMEAVVAVIILPTHEASHTFQACATQQAKTFLRIIGSSMGTLATGKTIQYLYYKFFDTEKFTSLNFNKDLKENVTISLGVILVAGGANLALNVYNDMHTPLPFFYFDTKEELFAYLQKHGFTMTDPVILSVDSLNQRP